MRNQPPKGVGPLVIIGAVIATGWAVIDLLPGLWLAVVIVGIVAALVAIGAVTNGVLDDSAPSSQSPLPIKRSDVIAHFVEGTKEAKCAIELMRMGSPGEAEVHKGRAWEHWQTGGKLNKQYQEQRGGTERRMNVRE